MEETEGPRIYDTRIPIKDRLTDAEKAYTAFLEIALETRKNLGHIVNQINVVKGSSLTEEDINSLQFKNRTTDISQRYGLDELGIQVKDITFYIEPVQWVKNLRNAILGEDKEQSAGTILKKVFFGNQEIYPMSILANNDQRDFHEEMHFVYGLINGYSLTRDQKILNELHSLHCDVVEGKREWHNTKYSVDSVAEYYLRSFGEFYEKKIMQWKKSVRALEVLDTIGEIFNIGTKLSEYALLACDSVEDLIGVADQVSYYKEPHEMLGYLTQIIEAKTSGIEGIKRLSSIYSDILPGTIDDIEPVREPELNNYLHSND